MTEAKACLLDGYHVFWNEGPGGDASYTRKRLELLCHASFPIDPAAGVASMRTLRKIAGETGAELRFGHDMEQFETYKKAPEFYG